MEFDLDPEKSSRNRAKHSSDFLEAQLLWLDSDRAKARRPAQQQRRVNVDFPDWMVESLDREARRLGVTRQSIIKMWLAEKLKESSA